jgi:hypothetical protein
MNEPSSQFHGVSPEARDLIDDYLSGSIAPQSLLRLEQLLSAGESLRAYFVRYSQLDTQLYLSAKANQAGAKAVAAIAGSVESRDSSPRTSATGGGAAGQRRWLRWMSGLAAMLVVALAAGWWLTRSPASDPGGDIAWLVNAQNVQWTDDSASRGELRSGRILSMHRGLAEIRFKSGASIVLEGPAKLELLSESSARLSHGKLTARVPESAKGFQIISPTGRVVDLGTEFGMSVRNDGSADVVVFEGKVEAYSGVGTGGKVSVTERQGARINADGVLKLREESAPFSDYTRTIVPPPMIVPRTKVLDFRRPADGTIRDRRGQGTGLTHRLPGTGDALRHDDVNLLLIPEWGQLELTTTRNDINMQLSLHIGEYLGCRLSDLGFTGVEDFEIAAEIPNIPALRAVGQFGLYAGSRSDKNIRGGLISLVGPEQYRAFLVNNDGGNDTDLHLIGLVSSGDDLRLVLRRVAGKYSMTVENQSDKSMSTLSILHPAFLDGDKDIQVGIFGANPRSDSNKTLAVRKLEMTVWTVGSAGSNSLQSRR